MFDNSMFYVACTISGFVLTLQIAHFWWKTDRDKSIGYWMAAGWVLVLSDVLFSLRPQLPVFTSRLAPTILVSLAYAYLFWGGRQAAGLPLYRRLVTALIALYGCGLVGIDQLGDFPNGRIVYNRFVWAGACFACYFALRKASSYFWKSINTPASVFLAQGVFYVLRAIVGVVVANLQWTKADAPLLFIGNMDVILFNESLFVAILIALLNQRQHELSTARVEMETLSGLLPVCAWCKKVRDDNGYWSEITEYFARKNSMQITHGICQACTKKLTPEPTP